MNKKTKTLVGIGLFTAIVVVLQLLGQFIKFGPVSISLVLLPIVIGSAIYGPSAGAILGGAFSIVVLSQPDTSFFYGMSVYGTVLVVLAKGILCGWLAGLSYKLFAKKSTILAVAFSAVVCPVVNTAIFFGGCMSFFYKDLSAVSDNVMMYVVTVFIGLNFIVELLVNVLCCPVIVRLIKIGKK